MTQNHWKKLFHLNLSGLKNIFEEKSFGMNKKWTDTYFWHKIFNFTTLFSTKNPHTSLHSNFFILGKSTSYVSQYSFALQQCWDTYNFYTSQGSYAVQACWDQYVIVLLCTWRPLDIWVPKPVGRMDLRRFERVKT